MNGIIEGVFDVLYIGKHLEKRLDDFLEYEIHFVSYFGCLLSLYDGNAVVDWRLEFVKTDMGSPYSRAISSSIENLLASGKISRKNALDGSYGLTKEGEELVEFQKNYASVLGAREKYLSIACDTISLVPIGVFKESISKDPVLYSARIAGEKRTLLEDSSPATKVLYSQFKDLKLALSDSYNDLIVPATVWLESLNRGGNPKMKSR